MKYTTFLPFFAATGALAVTHTVMVGGVKPPTDPTGTPTPQLIYTPENVMAAEGDVVEFNFMQMNHTVTQSSFDEPCKAMEGGFDSGFMPNPDGAAGITYSVTVNDTKPVWAYCKQKTGVHCGKGMVFSINAVESSDKSFASYKQLAIQKNGTGELTTAAIAATPAPAVQSTVTLAAGAAEATESAASVAQGDGQCSDGSACTCSCLCGQNSFPDIAAQNNFGGVAGMIPGAM